MDNLRLAHLLFLASWGGLVLAETVIELGSRPDDAGAVQTARLHFVIDGLFEVPLLAGIVATGALLLARAWPPTPLLVAKLACAVIALGANVYCAWLVVRRHRSAGDPAAVHRLASRIRLTGIGVPFGLVALIIGLGWLHRG